MLGLSVVVPLWLWRQKGNTLLTIFNPRFIASMQTGPFTEVGYEMEPKKPQLRESTDVT